MDKTIANALVAFQADLKPVDKNATNPFFKSEYMTLSNVMTSIQPLLSKHKLAVLQFVTNINGDSALKTVLVHESGQTLEADPQPLLLTKQDPQGQGSAITYARRYALCALLGIVADEDDDGNASSDPKGQNTSANPVSLAQKMLIKDIYDQAGGEDGLVKDYIKKMGYDPEKMTSAEASALIKDMQENGV